MGEKVKSNQLEKIIILLDTIINNNFVDIDDYYYDLLEQALEYGMTPKQFWEEDMEQFYCYRNAYFKKIHRVSHIQGLYNNIAIGICLANCLKKKSDKSLEYPKEDLFSTNINEVLNEFNKEKIITKVNKNNFEEQYRLRLSKCY